MEIKKILPVFVMALILILESAANTVKNSLKASNDHKK